MASNNQTQAPKADHANLERVALSLFGEMTRTQRGFNAEKVAHDAFRSAQAFLAVSSKIAAGELTAEPEPDLPTEYIEVPVWQQLADEKWVPVKDPVTNKIVTERAPVDRFAFAPNLPDEHPINMRFKPLDGRKPSERKTAEPALN